jgi:hypothetical protein
MRIHDSSIDTYLPTSFVALQCIKQEVKIFLQISIKLKQVLKL